MTSAKKFQNYYIMKMSKIQYLFPIFPKKTENFHSEYVSCLSGVRNPKERSGKERRKKKRKGNSEKKAKS